MVVAVAGVCADARRRRHRRRRPVCSGDGGDDSSLRLDVYAAAAVDLLKLPTVFRKNSPGWVQLVIGSPQRACSP